MRLVRFRRSNVIKFSLLGLLGPGLVVVMLRPYVWDPLSGDEVADKEYKEFLEWRREHDSEYRDEVAKGIPIETAGKGPKAEKHISHPGVKPVFLGEGKRGNFEPDKYGGGVGPGDNGRAHKLRVDQKQDEARLKGVYGFNQLVSDEISLNRTVPDQREKECRLWDYPTDLPSASVILVLHNEGWSTLLRTVNSVINRSPPQFLHEVVLVDDKSELEHIHEPLEKALTKPYYSKVKLVRNAEREGLIRSRNNGALAATGDVVVFLDAHCEVSYNWLPPLLAPIHEDRTTLSVPEVDGIEWDNFEMRPINAAGAHSRGLFEWGMNYKEGTLPAKEQDKATYHSEPYRAPTHAGGLFAMDREWFKELGWYDPGLWVWGGENFELSFKVWMCGGRSVWVPCSRVYHVYRGHSCSSCGSGSLANKFHGQPTTLRNYKRVVETWFDDEYKEFFYTSEPLARFVDMGDISEQLKMKKDLKCKSFDWYMTEIAYDVFYKYPKMPPNKFWGQIKNEATGQCLDTFGRHPPEKFGASGCHGLGGYQMFRLNTQGQLTSGEWCIVADKSDDVSVAWCDQGTTDGPWEYVADKKQMLHTKLGRCLALHPESKKMIMRECDGNNSYHKWEWSTITPSWAKKEKP